MNKDILKNIINHNTTVNLSDIKYDEFTFRPYKTLEVVVNINVEAQEDFSMAFPKINEEFVDVLGDVILNNLSK